MAEFTKTVCSIFKARLCNQLLREPSILNRKFCSPVKYFSTCRSTCRQWNSPNLLKSMVSELPITSRIDQNVLYYSTRHQEKDRSIQDPLINAFIKRIIAPSVASKKILVYEEDPRKRIENILDPSIIGKIILDLPTSGQPAKKEAHRMIRIRKRKMRKHKLRKFRKKYKFVLAKRKMQKLLRKEQAFRLELLTQIEEAEAFDPKQYVTDIIHKLRYYPKPPTPEEIREKYRLLHKKNRSNVNVIPPRFDD